MQKKTPNKIITTKIDLKENLEKEEIEDIIKIFKLDKDQKKDGINLINALYKILIKKDASLIEINPLVITKQKKLICLDAKMNFDDNALFRRPEILKLRDLTKKSPQKLKQANMV